MARKLCTTLIKVKKRRAALTVFTVALLLWYFFYYDPEVAAILSDAHRPRLLCDNFKGGIGNRLFQYAFIFTMATRHNMTPVIPREGVEPLQEVFALPYPHTSSAEQRACFSLPMMALSYNTGYDPLVKNFTFSNDLHLVGYYQSWRYFRHDVIEPELQRHFRFRPEIQRKRSEILELIVAAKWKGGPLPTFVGIHVRRGDMVKDENLQKRGYQVPGRRYFWKAMRKIRQEVEGPIVFLVASNDVAWARDAIESPDAVFLEGFSAGVDMAVLSRAQHFIMSVGTFGWWIAWRIPGIVIYFKHPFREGSELASTFSPDYNETFYHPRWIGMD